MTKSNGNCVTKYLVEVSITLKNTSTLLVLKTNFLDCWDLGISLIAQQNNNEQYSREILGTLENSKYQQWFIKLQKILLNILPADRRRRTGQPSAIQIHWRLRGETDNVGFGGWVYVILTQYFLRTAYPWNSFCTLSQSYFRQQMLCT